MAFAQQLVCVIALGIPLSAALPLRASAQQNIGSAVGAHNDVSRELAGSRGPIAEGDQVFHNEIVRTGVESTAKLVFLDSTALAVGPISRVVLDRFVYDPTPTSQSMAVNLGKGIFRFTTGGLDKSAYSITTPMAAIGVRGTVLDIGVDARRTRVTLVEGAALVCPRRKGEAFEQEARDCAKGHSAPGRHCDCVTLDHEGQTATVTASSSGPRASPTGPTVQFASLCGADPSMCSGAGTQFAGGAPLSSGWGAGSLCGR